MKFTRSLFNSMEHKTFETALINLFETEFGSFFGPTVTKAIVNKIKDLCDIFYPPKTSLTNGKMLWFAVHEDEKQSYGKTIEKTKIIPVTLSVTTYEDIKKYIDGAPIREILKDGIARILRDAKK